MSRIDRDEVEHVAALARLSVDDQEVRRLVEELDAILDYVESLRELDTSGIVPTAHPLPLSTPMRDDVATPGIDPRLAVANAPESAGSAFVVPRVLESESEG